MKTVPQRYANKLPTKVRKHSCYLEAASSHLLVYYLGSGSLL